MDDLKHRHIKISRIEEMNDPFEMLPAFKNIRQMELFVGHKASMHDTYGVLCFSKSWSNPLLWSHYADNHRGVCFGFDVSDEMILQVDYTPERLQHDIEYYIEEYKRNPEVFTKTNEDAILRHNEFLKRLPLTKYKGWEYEDEVRVFADLVDMSENGLYFADFGLNTILREVILGARWKNDDTKEIMNLLSGYGKDVALINGCIDFQTYSIVPCE